MRTRNGRAMWALAYGLSGVLNSDRLDRIIYYNNKEAAQSAADETTTRSRPEHERDEQ